MRVIAREREGERERKKCDAKERKRMWQDVTERETLSSWYQEDKSQEKERLLGCKFPHLSERLCTCVYLLAWLKG